MTSEYNYGEKVTFLPISATVSKNSNKKVRNDAYQHFEDASASVSEAISETDNEKGRFLPILETVSNNGINEQGSSTYSKNISNY